MKKILVLGAGRSTSVLIKYLLSNSEKEDWHIKVADVDLEIAKSKLDNHKRASAIQFNVNDDILRMQLINDADIVISMLPAHMHYDVAVDCIGLNKNMITASYVSAEIEKLNEKAKAAGILLLNEMGVDPGIDHMSAKSILDRIIDEGGEIELFESFAGGLLAPSSERNPWKYKFSWNPRNVVLAGSGGAVKFIQEGKYKYIPYHQVFRRTEILSIEGYGKFEGYANRDSLRYREVYNLQNIPTIYRGTLRRPGFCRAWDVFVKLGATDDSYIIENANRLTFREFFNLFLAYNPNDSVELKLMHYCKIEQDSDIMEKLEWLEIFENHPIPFERASPAQILQYILEQKWGLSPEDKDMLAMIHKFGYRLNGEYKTMESTMVIEGENSVITAMAKTVGLPVGIGCKLILNGKISAKGVQIPIRKEIYDPMLKELAENGIVFKEQF